MVKSGLVGWSVIVAGVLGCGSQARASSLGVKPVECPAAPDSTGSVRLVSVIVDGRLVATNVKAALERSDPESYQLESPEPPAVAAVSPESIDLIQFVRGPDAEREYHLCPGVVGFLMTTKRAAPPLR
jgi:hypothetical protein